MATIAYLTTRHFLIVERQAAVLHQAYANAALLRGALASKVPHIDAQLSSLDTGRGTASVLNVDGRWFTTSLAASRSTLPVSLRQTVHDGSVGTLVSKSITAPSLAVGVPLPAVHASYFLIYDLTDLQHTLRILLAALGAAATVTTLLGGALGLAASRRAMSPLTEVSDAAVSIAAGELGTRLPIDTRDPDLLGLTTSFNAMVDQLVARLERDARFTSDVSHELRSPLTTLAASLEVLESRRDELPDRERRAIELMAGDVQRFQRLVADLLEISRADAEADELNVDSVEAGELIRRSVIAAQRVIPGGEDLSVTVTPQAEHARLLADKRRIERIITNLLENAANHAGGASEVAVSVVDESVEVSVTDHGAGISPSERSKVFDRFYRGTAAGRRGSSGGSGLGLALVAEHVRRHGGSVFVEEGPGGVGSRFTVRLPLETSEPA